MAGQAGGHIFRLAGSWGVRFPETNGAGFHVLRRGEAWLITPNRAPVALRPGDVVFSPTGRDHGICHGPLPIDRLSVPSTQQPDSVSADAEIVCGGYQHVPGQLHPFLRSMPETVVMTPDYDRHPSLRRLVGLVAEEMQDGRPQAGLMIPALLDLLLIHTLRWWKQHGGWPAVADMGIAAALQAVHADLRAPWTVRRLSDVAGCSPATFTRRFTAALGESPMSYVIGRRLMHGAWLLRSTREPLAAVARRTGYSSEFAFSAAFSKRFLIAPGRYRNRYA
jgi:AraC-like DNA-binding protein